MKPALVAIASAMLLSGCLGLPQERIIPNPAVPHQVAEPVEVVIWAQRSDGTLVKETVLLDPGWWIASPQVVDPNP
jgi:hypothetical protein